MTLLVGTESELHGVGECYKAIPIMRTGNRRNVVEGTGIGTTRLREKENANKRGRGRQTESQSLEETKTR